MAIRRFNSRTDLYNAAKMMMGMPVINVQIAPAQFGIICDQAVAIFQRYMGMEGSYLSYYITSASAGTSSMSTSGLNIINVLEMNVGGGLQNINQLFSPEHILLTNGNGELNIFNNIGSTDGGSMVLANYQAYMQYIEMFRTLLSKEYQLTYRREAEVIEIAPTFKTDISFMFVAYTRESELNIINNEIFFELFVAMCTKLLGTILSRYTVTMPGGGTVNGDAILQRGMEEEKLALEKLRLESPPPDFFIY